MSEKPEVVIYHNPRCSKSRQTLLLLEERGIEPEVIRYLETPPTKQELKDVLSKLALSARDILRQGEEAYKAKGLDDQNLSDEEILDAMLEEPKLIQRPIVVANGKAVLGRPPENVLSII